MFFHIIRNNIAKFLGSFKTILKSERFAYALETSFDRRERLIKKYGRWLGVSPNGYAPLLYKKEVLPNEELAVVYENHPEKPHQKVAIFYATPKDKSGEIFDCS